MYLIAAILLGLVLAATHKYDKRGDPKWSRHIDTLVAETNLRTEYEANMALTRRQA
jgi:hypothetical protein